jgi:hypothetical protein
MLVVNTEDVVKKAVFPSPYIELLLYAGIALNFTCLNEHMK